MILVLRSLVLLVYMLCNAFYSSFKPPCLIFMEGKILYASGQSPYKSSHTIPWSNWLVTARKANGTSRTCNDERAEWRADAHKAYLWNNSQAEEAAVWETRVKFHYVIQEIYEFWKPTSFGLQNILLDASRRMTDHNS